MEKTFCIKTFGCKTNQFESEYFINSLTSMNYTLTKENLADIVIINSCAVTKEAERQIMQYMRKLRRNFHGIKIVITGCFVDNNFQKICESNIANIIVSNFYKKHIPEIIQKSDFEKFSVLYYKDIKNENLFTELISTETNFHTRKFFKIQDGCNNFCSYCIIPYLRGKPRSLDVNRVTESILKLSGKFKEVVITGINIGIYGKDLGFKNGLLHLLQAMEIILQEKNVNDFRIRLSSLKPDEITDDFINFLKKSRYICPHFHLSIQNFNNNILKSMNRKYNYSLIKDRIDSIKSGIPDVSIGADIITGFPGEGKNEFKDNVNKMESIDIDFFHIFPFSKRDRTKAFSLYDPLTKNDKKKRVNILKNLADIKKENFIKKNLNKNFKILIESYENGYLTGYSENYIKFYIPSCGNLQLKNCFLDVKGESIKNKYYILGRIL